MAGPETDLGGVMSAGLPAAVLAGDPGLVRKLAEQALKIQAARENLRDFIEYCMIDPERIADDPLATRYFCARHHELIIRQFTETIEGRILRAALSIPPQHGKSTICAEYGIAFLAARNPHKRIIYGTYSDRRARIVGESVRRILESERFRDVFPEFELRKGAASKEMIGFEAGGSAMFVGRTAGTSGNPCDFFIIDDPFKDRREARSEAIREEVWDWYCSVVEARCPMMTPIFVIHTRWSDDDLIGRLCDPDHPMYDPEEHDNFEYLNLPAIIERGDTKSAEILGLDPETLPQALWPATNAGPQWPLERLRPLQKKNRVVFSAVFMGRPQPPEGSFYTKDMIRYYREKDIRGKRFVNYGASDHAVSTARRADHTVMGIGMVDENNNMYIHRDLIWDKLETDKQVDGMARLIKAHKPLKWWSEGDHIKKAIGPFLKLRLRMLRLFTTLFEEIPKNGDKIAKSQPMLAMAQMGMLYLPADAPWTERAVDQMLRFDGSEGRPDDFCDFLGNLGRGLSSMMAARPPRKSEEKNIKTGSAAWVKMAGRAQKLERARKKNLAGW